MWRRKEGRLMAMAEREVLEPYQLCYSDLISLSSADGGGPSLPIDEVKRLQTIAEAIIENLGPTGPGLLTITAVPGASALRKSLLPLARDLALLRNEDRKRVLKDHGLGSDVPLKNLDRTVSSFSMQLKYEQYQNVGARGVGATHACDFNHNAFEPHYDIDKPSNPMDNKFENLGYCFKELGFCMMDLGLHLARICDRAIGCDELHKILLEACMAKGRLIHYHSVLDTHLIKEHGIKNGSFKTRLVNEGIECTEEQQSLRTEKRRGGTNGGNGKHSEKPSKLWQQWHYDYGLFTVLTSPMFISPCDCGKDDRDSPVGSCGRECPSPSGHSYLQIFDPNKNAVRLIKAPPESFIVQVGESADILSKGKLRSTLHCVCRPEELENLSRENFVVFLQPAWTKVFDLSDYPMEQSGRKEINHGCSATSGEIKVDELEKIKLNENICNMVPPLTSRLKNGMTFAEFSRETTKQYYGGGGLQSNC